MKVKVLHTDGKQSEFSGVDSVRTVLQIAGDGDYCYLDTSFIDDWYVLEDDDEKKDAKK